MILHTKKKASKEQFSERGVVQKIYDLMLYTASPHPERDRETDTERETLSWQEVQAGSHRP